MSKFKLPTMTKSEHWRMLGFIYVICFILAFVCFMTLPVMGLFIVFVPGLLTIAAVVLYIRNNRK